MAHTALWLVLCVLPGTLSYIPVIGIAAEPTAGNDKPALKKLGTSLLAASYGPCNHTVTTATTSTIHSTAQASVSCLAGLWTASLP